jgi:hypothetical protein
MADPVIIAKRTTVAGGGALDLNHLSAPNGVIPANPATVQLSDWNTTTQIQEDPQLKGYITATLVILNVDGTDLSATESENFATTVTSPSDPTYESTTDTTAGAGNIGLFLKTDGAGNLDGRDIAADGSAQDSHIADMANPHNTDLGNLGSGTKAELNALITDGTVLFVGDSLNIANLTLAGQAQGDVLYYNGTSWTRLPAGTSGQFLQTSGAAANPVWATPSGSGNVSGPGSSTDNALVRWDGTTGTLIQNSTGWILGDTGILTGSTGSLVLPQGTAPAPTTEGQIAWDTDDNRLQVGSGSGTISLIGDNTSAGGDLGGTYPNPTVTDFTISGQAQGDILYFDGTNWVRLAPGTSGQVLQTNGAAANPSWVTPSGSGTLNHAALTSNLAWATSGHTGTASTFAAFTAGGATTNLSTTASGGDVAGTWPALTVTDFTITGEAQGDVLYFNGTNWVRLAAGTTGQFLQTQGTGANPQWATSSGSGNVSGPGSSTDNALVRWDGATGTLIQNSTGWILGDTGILDGSGGSLTIPQGTAPAPTTEGQIAWDTDDNRLQVGSGSGTITLIGDNTAAGGDLSGTYPNPVVERASTDFALTGVITPTTLAASQNNYSPTGLADSSTLRLSASTPVSITGLAGGASGRILILTNVGSSAITLEDEDAGSTAANRFALPVDVKLNAEDSIILQYDGTSSRWRAPATSKGSVAGDTKSRFTGFSSNATTARGDFATLSLGANGTANFTFSVPPDYTTLVSLQLVVIAASTAAALDIDISSDYGAAGEAYNTNSESNTTSTFSVTVDQLSGLDISSVFSALAANDFCGIFVDHNAIGQTLYYLGVFLRYT